MKHTQVCSSMIGANVALERVFKVDIKRPLCHRKAKHQKGQQHQTISFTPYFLIFIFPYSLTSLLRFVSVWHSASYRSCNH